MDWNKDGIQDILSGCYWTDDAKAGQIQILLGRESQEASYAFEESKALLNAEGKPLENLPEDKVKDQNQIETICTHQHAVDYDGDGDLDLVVGSFGSNLYYYQNNADDPAVEPQLAKPVKMEIRAPSFHGAPHFVDFDKDGDLDLISGSAEGGVFIAHNIGSKTEPEYDDFQKLVPTSSLHSQNPNNADIKMAPSTRVWVTDFNKDGLLDLLVGDSTTISKRKEGVSQEEYEKLQAEFEKKSKELSEKQQAIFEKHEDELKEGKELPEEVQKEMEKLNSAFREVFESRSEFDASERTGFVWLLLQKAG